MFDDNKLVLHATELPKSYPPLIVLGMHRSGTSFLANWLVSCGFYFGDELLGRGNGNEEGHFEDLQILRLHEAILKSNRKSYQLASPFRLKYSEEQQKQAQSLHNNRKHRKNWGWKEPRTCLTMDLWEQVVPKYQSLVVFRDYRQVVDSFLRRKQKAIKKHDNPVEKTLQTLKYRLLSRRAANRFLRVWIEYNRRILETLERKDKSDYLVLNESRLGDCDWMLFQYMKKEWGHQNLQFVLASEVFKPNLIQRKTAQYDFDLKLLEQAEQISLQLEKYEHQSVLRLLNLCNQVIPQKTAQAIEALFQNHSSL